MERLLLISVPHLVNNYSLISLQSCPQLRAAFLVLYMMRKTIYFIAVLFLTVASHAQVIDPSKSANAAAVSDKQYIANSIAYNEGVIFLTQKGTGQVKEERLKELVQQMLTDHSQMLYSMEQLEAAGTGESNLKSKKQLVNKQAIEVNGKLPASAGPDFDSVWVANLLIMQDGRYNELVQAKETVTNPQLKMVITEAVPLVRKHLSQLKSIQKYLIRVATQKRKEEAQRKKEEEAARKSR